MHGKMLTMSNTTATLSVYVGGVGGGGGGVSNFFTVVLLGF